MVRGTKTMRLAARYAPLAFGFCLMLGLLGPRGLGRVRVPVQTCKAWQAGPQGVLAASMRAVPKPMLAVPVGASVAPLVANLPLALQEPISGPELFVGSGELVRQARKGRSKAPRAQAGVKDLRATGMARLRIKSIGHGFSRLEYRVGQPVRPETVRLPDRAQLRVMVQASPASIRRLKNYNRSKQGFSVQARALGRSKLALHLSCDAHCELGTVQTSPKGWSVQVRHLEDPSLSLR